MIPFIQYQVAGIDINFIIYFLTSIYMQWFYYGLISGIFFITMKSNLPNRIDVFIGRRIGNHLTIHTKKQVSNKAIDTNNSRGNKPGTYILAGEMSDMSMKHFAFENPLMIFDEDSATQVIGLKGGKILKTVTGNPMDFSDIKKLSDDLQKLVENGTIKVVKGKLPVRYDINPMWALSAEKLYRYFKGKMLLTTWMAIIQKVFGQNYIQLIIGAAIGGALVLGIYPYFAPVHYIPVVQTVTQTATSNATSIAHTTTQSIRTITSQIGG